MSMSYCQFENLLSDLKEARENVQMNHGRINRFVDSDDVSDDEKVALRELVSEMKDFVEDYENYVAEVPNY